MDDVWGLPRQQFVEHETERIHIALRSRRTRTLRKLRSHELQRSEQLSLPRFKALMTQGAFCGVRDSEVDDVGSIFAIDQDVVRLEISVDDTSGMRSAHCVAYLGEHAEASIAAWIMLKHPTPQRSRARNELHGDPLPLTTGDVFDARIQDL